MSPPRVFPTVATRSARGAEAPAFRTAARTISELPGRIVAEEGAKAVLILAEQGRIEGEVRVPVVVINGALHGDVHASERVELAAKARVVGNVHYQVVEMRAGATLTGRLIHADAEAEVASGPVLVAASA